MSGELIFFKIQQWLEFAASMAFLSMSFYLYLKYIRQKGGAKRDGDRRIYEIKNLSLSFLLIGLFLEYRTIIEHFIFDIEYLPLYQNLLIPLLLLSPLFVGSNGGYTTYKSFIIDRVIIVSLAMFSAGSVLLYFFGILGENYIWITLAYLALFIAYSVFKFWSFFINRAQDNIVKFNRITLIFFTLISLKMFLFGTLDKYLSVLEITIFMYSVALFLRVVFKFNLQSGVVSYEPNEGEKMLRDREATSEIGYLTNDQLDDRDDNIRRRLIKYFEEEKPYLRADLSINEVASYLYSNKSYVSRVINDHFKKNFNQFVNFYRIEEAKRIFLIDRSLSITNWYQKAGFGSMASFCISFRIYTGASPADWCKEQKSKIRMNEIRVRANAN
jgi:AraC-like DNA-binding protein